MRRWVLGAVALSGECGRGGGCAVSMGGLVGGRAAFVAWWARFCAPSGCQRAASASVVARRPLPRGLGAAWSRR